MTNQEIIDKIRQLRNGNNILWMKLLEIALAHAGDETKRVLRQINANDHCISELLAELAQ